mmetsp:Transcript_37786/g.120069  ORF Transcript_37786/g.120069 Transcript_37786/m.120069 type:complete len:344 (+) Transcript_37786:1-1032(+)
MTELRNLDSENTRLRLKLRQYLSENHITMNLTARIWGYINSHHRGQRRRLTEREVGILSVLPKNVISAIREEIYSPIFDKHPFLSRYTLHNPTGMGKVFNSAMREVCLEAGEELFTVGDVAERMYYIAEGSLAYDLSGADDGKDMHCDVAADQWICEVVLWARWTHRGVLVAKERTEACGLDASAFREIVGFFAPEDPMLGTYARLFERQAFLRLDLLDLWTDQSLLEDLAWCAFRKAPGAQDALPCQSSGDASVSSSSGHGVSVCAIQSDLSAHNVTPMPEQWSDPQQVDLWHKEVQRLRANEHKHKHRLFVHLHEGPWPGHLGSFGGLPQRLVRRSSWSAG